MDSNTTRWSVLGASVTGTSHHQAGRGCDDAHAYHSHEGLLFLAVADGAGSATLSSLGAATAIQAACAAAEQILLGQPEPTDQQQWLSVLSLILNAAHTALLQLSQDTMTLQEQPSITPLREFATTLLLTIVSTHWLATVQIGDGCIVIERLDGTLEALTPPTQSEYINETTFLTATDYLAQAEYTMLSCTDIEHIALFSDGLQMIALNFPTNLPHKPFFGPLFRFAASPDATEAELRSFLASERVCAQTDDDKTLVLAVRR